VVAQASDGTLRLYVGGQDDSGVSNLRAWGKRNVLDGSIAFTSKIRARRTFGPGKKATVWNPTMYYRNPQGDTSGALSCTVSFIRNYNAETISETFTLESTQDDNGISLKEKVFESVEMGDTSVLDVVISMTYTPTVAGVAYDSVMPPTIDALIVPFKVQETTGR